VTEIWAIGNTTALSNSVVKAALNGTSWAAAPAARGINPRTSTASNARPRSPFDGIARVEMFIRPFLSLVAV
jgi:hypothetical protein